MQNNNQYSFEFRAAGLISRIIPMGENAEYIIIYCEIMAECIVLKLSIYIPQNGKYHDYYIIIGLCARN